MPHSVPIVGGSLFQALASMFSVGDPVAHRGLRTQSIVESGGGHPTSVTLGIHQGVKLNRSSDWVDLLPHVAV